MLFHVRLTHSPDNCWARDEHEGKPSEFLERIEDPDGALGVTVRQSFIAPNEHTFFLLLEAESAEGITEFLGPPVLQDHQADVVPVTTFGQALDALDVQ